MAGLLARFFRRPSPDFAASVDERLRARRIADALARANDLGHHANAARLVTEGEPLLHRDAWLATGTARYYLDAENPDAALAAIAVSPALTDDLRRLRIIAWQRAGKRQRARRDLFRWSREPKAPRDVHRRLALAEWAAGDVHAARTALLRDIARGEDPETLALLALTSIASQRPEGALAWAERAEEASLVPAGRRRVMFESLDLTASLVPPAQPARVARLAAELLESPMAISTLVALERRRPDHARHELVTAALTRVVTTDPSCRPAFEALALLALERGERPAAAQWATRGLAHHPRAILLANVQAAIVEPFAPSVAGRISPVEDRAA